MRIFLDIFSPETERTPVTSCQNISGGQTAEEKSKRYNPLDANVEGRVNTDSSSATIRAPYPADDPWAAAIQSLNIVMTKG